MIVHLHEKSETQALLYCNGAMLLNESCFATFLMPARRGHYDLTG